MYDTKELYRFLPIALDIRTAHRSHNETLMLGFHKVCDRMY